MLLAGPSRAGGPTSGCGVGHAVQTLLDGGAKGEAFTPL